MIKEALPPTGDSLIVGATGWSLPAELYVVRGLDETSRPTDSDIQFLQRCIVCNAVLPIAKVSVYLSVSPSVRPSQREL